MCDIVTLLRSSEWWIYGTLSEGRQQCSTHVMEGCPLPGTALTIKEVGEKARLDVNMPSREACLNGRF